MNYTPLKISIAICTHNEGEYVSSLLRRLTSFVELDIGRHVTYEIVVLDDFSTDQLTLDAFDKYNSSIKLYHRKLDNNYAEHKNFLNSQCTGDWILNLDADEFVSDEFLEFVPNLIDMNPLVQAYHIPRINTVDGLTIAHLQKWGWMVTKLEDHRRIKVMDVLSPEYKLLRGFDMVISQEENVVTYYEPIVAWPDYQTRLYKNIPEICWTKPVHEQLSGYVGFGTLPMEPGLAIRHYKDIDRQEQQNNFYDTLQR
jgi:glycosyltransferase involved in cell wall biosynthesis